MPRDIDVLTSATLKHLRDRWWDPSFTQFLRETLQPRAGTRILDVGCGGGIAELNLGLLHLPQVDLVGIDLVIDRVREAVSALRGRNIPAQFAGADAAALPFPAAVFDSTFCVAVLQHVRDVPRAIEEFARVTKPGGRILVVEPDNHARYWYSSLETGVRAFELGARFFMTLAEVRGDATDLALGPKLPGIFSSHGIEALTVNLFPVSVTRLGAPPSGVWEARRQSVREAVSKAPDQSIRRLGADYLKLLDKYAEDAAAAGHRFVEIQNTMLFATVGQRAEE